VADAAIERITNIKLFYKSLLFRRRPVGQILGAEYGLVGRRRRRLKNQNYSNFSKRMKTLKS
jgi:hypothetical protein